MRKRILRQKIHDHCGERVQSLVSRLKYASGLRPSVNFQQSEPVTTQDLYPQPYRACLVLSADFELAWGWCRAKDKTASLSYARTMAHRARQNFPDLLALFERYEVPVTWPTVGHLLLESCSRDDEKVHPEVLRMPYFTNEYWRYTEGDWFDMDPASTVQAASEWYAPDLIRQILNSPVDHEIACHTFSHIDFSDERCPPGVADSELRACCETALASGIELRSFVFPGNLAGNLLALRNHGFSGYRIEGRYELDHPRQDPLGLWQIPGGICLHKPFSNWQDVYWVDILKRYVDLALETGTVCHFWFHPSMNSDILESVFPKILAYITDRRQVLWCTTMRNLVNWLNNHEMGSAGGVSELAV